MRSWSRLLAWSIVGFLFGVPTLLGNSAGQDAAAPPGTTWEHVQPKFLTLAPGERQSYALTFEAGTFEESWIFLLNARLVEGDGHVAVHLWQGHDPPRDVAVEPGRTTDGGTVREPVASWTYEEPGFAMHTVRLPDTDVYALEFHNAGTTEAKMVTFYDQSCNCASKPIPVELAQGSVIFNVNVQRGDTWRASFPEAPVHEMHVVMARQFHPTGVWPHDFAVLDVSEEPTVDEQGRRVHVIEFKAAETERLYFVAFPIKTDRSKIDDSNPPFSAVMSMMVIPFYEKVEDQGAPGPGVVPVVALLLVGASMIGGRRRR